MKIIIELNEENLNPYYVVFCKNDNGGITHLECFTFRSNEPETSPYHQEVNYQRALAYAEKLERKLKGEAPLKTIIYEKEI